MKTLQLFARKIYSQERISEKLASKCTVYGKVTTFVSLILLSHKYKEYTIQASLISLRLAVLCLFYCQSATRSSFFRKHSTLVTTCRYKSNIQVAPIIGKFCERAKYVSSVIFSVKMLFSGMHSNFRCIVLISAVLMNFSDILCLTRNLNLRSIVSERDEASSSLNW